MAEPERIFFYGTLMLPYPTLEHLGAADMLAFQGWDAVTGQLFNLGRYPALALVPDGEWAAHQGQSQAWDDFFASRAVE